METRSILHLDLDTFFVSVERVRDSRLNGRPIIIGGSSDRGVVSSCSYEARSFGVRSAMPMKMARAMCPEAVFIRGDMELYTKYSRMVTDIIADKAPLYEKASVDEHYVDLTGMERFHGCASWSHELRDTIIRETGLPISIGLSVNKTVSKIAAGEAKPNGEREVAQQQVLPFLDPLSIRKIPMIGRKTYHTLRSMGISTIHTLRVIPAEMLGSLMGQNGMEIWKKANGIDNTPVIRYSEQKSVSTEHTFDRDTTDTVMLNQMIVSMTEKLAYELRRQEKLASCLTVRIRYSDFDTRRLWQRRMLIRLIGVKVSGLVRGVQQLNMFEDTPEMVNLYMTMDRLRGRFGRHAIRRAAGVMTAAERSERELRKASELLAEKSRIEERLRGWHFH